MNKVFLEVFNEGLSPNEMNAVRGGAADSTCTCYSGGTYDCGCFNNVDCTCFASGTLTCSRNNCSCNASTGTSDNKKPGGPATGV